MQIVARMFLELMQTTNNDGTGWAPYGVGVVGGEKGEEEEERYEERHDHEQAKKEVDDPIGGECQFKT